MSQTATALVMVRVTYSKAIGLHTAQRALANIIERADLEANPAIPGTGIYVERVEIVEVHPE